MSELSDLNFIVDRAKRLISKAVVSGTYTDTDMEYYVQDATGMIPLDYPSFSAYTVIIGSGISPSPSITDFTLLSLKTAILAHNAHVIEMIGDAVAIKAGSISLDTSKSLRAKGMEADRLEKQYKQMIDNLLINLSGSSSSGYRLDVYKTIKDEEEDSESLI